MSSNYARIYMKVNNPHGGNIPGVPLDNLTHEQWDGLAEWQKKSVDASPFYRKPTSSTSSKKKSKTKADPASPIPGTVETTKGVSQGKQVSEFIEGATLEANTTSPVEAKNLGSQDTAASGEEK